MKSHAFIRSSIQYILEFEKNKNLSCFKKQIKSEKQIYKNVKKLSIFDKSENSPNFSSYLYFLFAPTLVYKLSYPRTNKIRWNFVISNFTQTFCCFLFAYYLFVRFCFSQFSTFGKFPKYTLEEFIIACSACTLPGGFMLLLLFYGYLHSWLNAFAEMLRFGDRLFYKDWWNCTSFSTWYRTWNVVVHDWLYTYIYSDIQLITSNYSKALSATIVFWLSAAVHEYVISISLRFVFPIMFINFALVGVVLFFVRGTTRQWNVTIWIMLFLGNGKMLCLYSMEWYARKNCLPVFDNWYNIFVPHMLYCKGVNFTLTS